MTITLDLRIILTIGITIVSFLIGYLVSSLVNQKRFDTFVSLLPTGKTLFLGELNDEECDEVLDLIRDYAEGIKKDITFVNIQEEED